MSVNHVAHCIRKNVHTLNEQHIIHATLKSHTNPGTTALTGVGIDFDDVFVAPSQQRTAFSFKSSENDFAFNSIFYGHRRKRIRVDNFKVGIILGIKMYAGMGLARDACWAVTAGRPHIVVNRGATESCFYLTKDLRDAATGLSGNHYFFNA